MTAPFVTTVTKPAAPGSSSRLRRALLTVLVLLPLLLAIIMLVWLVTPHGESDTDSWMDRLFRQGERKQLQMDSVCSLPKEVGPCRGAMPRYFYNTETGMCEDFIYGGCEGNDNNFKTLDTCTELCAKNSNRKQAKEDDSICTLPMVIGPCRAAKRRYFHNAESGTCEEFLYGGCDGNENNFESLSSCNERCTKNADRKQPKKNGAAICSLPAEVGDCRAALPRYHYDTEQGRCQEFTYGGCGGNGNNFETLQACEDMCASSQRAAGSDCTSEPDGGNCYAYFERFAFNPESQACEQFVYGGCGGNGNRYSSREECEDHCRSGNTGQQQKEEEADYDTKICGVPFCPADCTQVRVLDECAYCMCGDSPEIVPELLPAPAPSPEA